MSLGDETKKTFVEKVIQEMSFRNISFVTLADGVGENVSSIKQALYGRRKIKPDLAKKLCDYLHLDFYSMTKDDSKLNLKSYTFGQKFGNYLDVNSLTQNDVAKAVGVTFNATADSTFDAIIPTIFLSS